MEFRTSKSIYSICWCKNPFICWCENPFICWCENPFSHPLEPESFPAISRERIPAWKRARKDSRTSKIVIGVLYASLVAGCAPPPPKHDSLAESQEAHRRSFGTFDIPHKIGSVENCGLQLPAVSPDGTSMLYLRTDAAPLSPMTLLGSQDLADTPREGTLAVWLRPVEGTQAGRRISTPRWCHSAVWSASGRTLAYVADDPPGTSIRLVDVESAKEETLGVAGQVNCLPRFGRDDRTLIFCSGREAAGPCRVFRQSAGSEPVPISPDDADCVFPALLEDDGAVICGCVEAEVLDWVRCSAGRMTRLAHEAGVGRRPALLQAWAAIPTPISPDGLGIAFFDGRENRIAVLEITGRLLSRHRPGTISACWLSNQALATATPDGLFAVDARTGVSLPLMNGSWIPLSFVAARNRLILLGKEGSTARLPIVELLFHPQPAEAAEKRK